MIIALLLIPLVVAFWQGVALADAVGDMTTLADAQTKLAAPLRGEGDLAIDGVEGKKQEKIVVVERQGTAGPDVYVELQTAKQKYLLLGSGETYAAKDGKAAKAALDSTIDGTSFTVEDLFPFWSKRCATMRVADTQSNQLTLTCEPAKGRSQYPLVVYKFDREKAVPVQVLYYKDTMSNLVKMRRNSDLTKVGDRWRPATVTMQDFKVQARDELTLKWSAPASVNADLFDPTKFATTTP
jgi:hypothetical protein